MTEETTLRHELIALRRAYEDAARPIVERLVALEARKLPNPPYVLLTQLSADEREAITKSIGDMMCYGTGIAYLEQGGEIQHVPFEDWQADPSQRGD